MSALVAKRDRREIDQSGRSLTSPTANQVLPPRAELPIRFLITKVESISSFLLISFIFVSFIVCASKKNENKCSLCPTQSR